MLRGFSYEMDHMFNPYLGPAKIPILLFPPLYGGGDKVLSGAFRFDVILMYLCWW